MSGWLNQDQSERIPKGDYNPWEYGLKERQEEERKAKVEKEAKQKEDAEERARQMHEEEKELQQSLPKPSGPSDEEFERLLADCLDSDAKLSLIKGRAASLFTEGFLEMASAAYTMAIGLASSPSHALFGNRSACRCGFGDYAGALEDANTCIKIAPTWAKGYVRRGAALHGLFRMDEAVQAFEDGLAHDPNFEPLRQGLADALRRRKAAGGDWSVVVDGAQEINTDTRKGDRMLPQLGHVDVPEDAEGIAHLSIHPAPSRHIVVIDGIHVKIFDVNDSHRVREFNTQYKDAGSKTFDSFVVGACCDVTGRDPALYTVEAGKHAQLLRLLIPDTRSMSDKRENPDKKLREVTNGYRKLGLVQPRGMALVDTSRMAGGCDGASALYVCDSGNGHILALDPKELDKRFVVGRPGSGDGELDTPVSVAAHGDYLAVADAGNYRVCIFTLRGTFIRALGERPSRFSSGSRPGQFMRPPAHVALAEGHLFVLEDGASRVHVLNPETGEPRGLLFPPYNTIPPSKDVVKARLQAREARELAKSKKAKQTLSKQAASGANGESGCGGGGDRKAQGNGGSGQDEDSDSETFAGRGCLVGLCVSDDSLFVMSDYGPHPRILRLPRRLLAQSEPRTAAETQRPPAPNPVIVA